MGQGQQYRGRVDHIKLIKAHEPTLVHVRLLLDDGSSLPCLIAHKPLTFMMEVHEGDLIRVYGHTNQRGQFVIRRYLSAHKHDPFDLPLPPHLQYPHRKEDA